MQNYYRLLGIPPTASPTEIGAAYQRQRARLMRLARHDRAMQARLAELETGYQILSNPRRRLAYDQLREEEPDDLAPLIQARQEREFRLVSYARVARSINLALLACCLLLFTDWVLPLRHFAHERVLSRQPTAVSAYRADARPTLRVLTSHTQFELAARLGHRVRSQAVVEVWQTPLLGVVRWVRVGEEDVPAGPEARFRPNASNIYGNFALLPMLIFGLSLVGSWPGRSTETYLNTASVAAGLTLIALFILL
jgi:hypothetical protein